MRKLIAPLLLICTLHFIHAAQKIDHVVVLMMENRSFDHILGFLKKNNSNIDGCLPELGSQCANPLDPTDPSSPWVSVNDQAQLRQVADPGHSWYNTRNQVFGDGNDTVDPAPMTGFIKEYSAQEVIMECFPPETVPALASLVSEFTLIDRWFPAVPGPTQVNRVYLFSATSDGWANTDDEKIAEGWTQRSIFEQIDESIYNLTWGVYFGDYPTAWLMRYVRRHTENIHAYHEFYKQAKEGTLPSFSFIEPRYFDIEEYPATDQHPDHDVGLGDQFIKDIYESLRASPLWNRTLFLITYDEHGGFFDHVSPPRGSPNPDGKLAMDVDPPFNFDRLGVRVPALLVSPWVPKGLVVHNPNTTYFEHSSLSTTLINLLYPDQKLLTKRDAWAAPFDYLLSLDQPRNDCISTLPSAPTHRDYGFLLPKGQIGTRQLSELQKSMVKTASALGDDEIDVSGEDMTEAEAFHFIRERINGYLEREVVKH